MKKFFYVRYGELTLKGRNKNSFIRCLFKNIKSALIDFTEIKIVKEFDNLKIFDFSDCHESKIREILRLIPGISNIYLAHELDNNHLVTIGQKIIELYRSELDETFKIYTRRQNKNYELNSMQINCKLGEYILKQLPEAKVDVHHPKTLINVEIKTNSTIIYSSKIKGFGGFPVGINGRVLMLLSGGIDSPIAAKLIMKKGYLVDFVTFISPPHTKPEALQKVRDLIKIITLAGRLEKPRLYVVNFTKLQHEISHINLHSYQITIMRRYFFRIAQYLAKTQHYDALGTGESLGQVASQTIESMTVISAVLENLLVLRPLLTFDKTEIIELAKRFSTYEISILPFADSCSLFVPTKPVIKPTITTATKLEKDLELIEDIYNNTLAKDIMID